MISLIRCLKLVLGKRGELRYGNILPAPKLSSSYRVLKYLSSLLLLENSLRRSDCLNVNRLFVTDNTIGVTLSNIHKLFCCNGTWAIDIQFITQLNQYNLLSKFPPCISIKYLHFIKYML